ncbi:type II CRISPR RNA-guided endonuclease Cas9 [Hujiaoplasma nucleasis]|uniref:CRISPR-associated endonuclease Cas9 n=1 Tax=Hujiaoplasma nucleasis TaxID=2725268 RepID=A0A7L6N489_9MOLU|nr:type II CRISPR RNA-guided endonuclease Cas9 [Hujiaoplasma nucleasis]QLY40371.1 type II CRISPR RNA-guided endonuclease Cas9 [Hujiaoplasma nucleasis]
MENKKVYLGLDLGTESCGWAVTDENYEIIKKSGKHLHGVRKFAQAETAEVRRLKRSSRRRLERRKFRLKILQTLFNDEIIKIDPNFFLRLNNSFFNKDDKDNELGKYSLFNDKLFTDKEYYSKFKTIFHLRQYLMNSTEKEDIRLIYLACHNILKYRGNFLMEGNKIETSSTDYGYIFGVFSDLNESLLDFFGDDLDYWLSVDNNDIDEILNGIKNTTSVNEHFHIFNRILNKDNNKNAKKLLELISDKTVQLKDLLDDDKYKDLEQPKIKFSDAKYDTEIEPILFDMVGDAAEIIFNAKKIYNWFTVKSFLKDSNSISEAKVREYNNHHDDLIKLKKFIRKFYGKREYDKMFRVSDEKIKNYVAYVKTNLINNKKEYVKGCSYDDFLKTLRKLMKDFEEKFGVNTKENAYSDKLAEAEYKQYLELKDKIDNQTILPKQRVTTNGVIPYQLHLNELETILDKASIHYSFLTSIKNEYTVKDKIIELMKFRIPYYIGPLNDTHKDDNDSGFAWIERLEKGKVLPWNFDDKVNVDKSAENFIKRMTRKCTYLKNEDVLPKNSLLYSEYKLLNELNNIQINKEPISVELKTRLINDLFKKHKKVTQKSLLNFLYNEGLIDSKEEILISGIDGDFKNNLSSYISFKKIFGDFESDYNKIEMIEKIIFILTIFEEKGMAIKKIEKDYPSISEQEIKLIKSLNFLGWGNLSKEFLQTKVIRVDNQTGETTSIIDLMRRENINLQQALYDSRYNFIDKINEINGVRDEEKKLSYEELIKDVYVSPGIKRSLWQALKIVDEIKKILNRPIDKFFVEVTRGGGEKGKRTKSRYQQIENLYNSAKKDASEINKMKDILAKYKSDEEKHKLRAEKLFLYFMQLGKCMYSNEPIDLDKLETSEYDIDHIIPRAYLKDDSITNKVLVKRNLNATKTDNYPLDNNIINKMLPYWSKLKDLSLVNDEKFKRLTRNYPLSPDEKGDFVNRQLVFTNQAVKVLNEILIKTNPDSKVIYSKAGNVSDFRNKFDIVKSRLVNDFHHAHDAYLNIVVGNTYNTKFGSNAIIFFRKNNDVGTFTNTEKMFERDVPGAWKKDGETIKMVKKMLSLKDVLVTKMVTERKDDFYDETIYPKGTKAELFPLKSKDNRYKDTDKYGGYKSLKIAYFIIVEHTLKNKRVITIEGIPVIHSYEVKHNNLTLDDVLKDYLKLEDPKVLVSKIKVGTLFKIKDAYANLAGKADNAIITHNSNQLFLNESYINYIKLIEKHSKQYDKITDIKNVEEDSFVLSISKDKNKKNQSLSKEMNLSLFDELISKFSISIYNGLTMGNYYENLIESRDKFVALNVRQQAHSLNQILIMMHCNASTGDLSLFMERASNKGSNKRNKGITNENITIYDESITGFYRKVRWQNQ